MFEKMTVADQEQLFSGTLVLFDKKITKVERISAGELYFLRDLKTQKQYTEAAAYKKITPPYTRIGMVNMDGSVIYCERKPIRQYQVGFSKSNVNFHNLPSADYPEGFDATLRHVQRLDSVNVFEAITNKYPSLQECFEHVEEFGGAMAFDKQFALNHRKEVYYKRNRVGLLPKKKKLSVKDIAFKPGYENLFLLLENEYEKAVSTS